MAKKSTTRIQLDLSDDAVNQLNHLKDITAASTNAEVFKEAMASHGWLVERYQRGEKILVKSPEEEQPREVEILNFTVTTIGIHRERIFRQIQSREFTDMRITEEQLQLGFPHPDAHERRASGLSGLQLVSQVDLVRWLEAHGLRMKKEKLETDLYTKWIDIEKVNYMRISNNTQSLLNEIAYNENYTRVLTSTQVSELGERVGIDHLNVLGGAIDELEKSGIVKKSFAGHELFLDQMHIDEYRRQFPTQAS